MQDVAAILRYDDAPAAFEWLERAFGCQRDFEVPGDGDGSVVFAQLRFGEGGAFGSGSARPGLREAIAVHVDDVKAHYARAVAAGVTVTQPLQESDFAAGVYTAVDSEGNAWSFGTNRLSETPHCVIFPSLRYREPHAAIDWLERNFGAERLAVYDAPDGSVAHAELRLGSGIVMCGTYRHPQVSGRGVDGFTSATYVYVADVDAHYECAVAAGARVVVPLADTDYDARTYSCLDIEGRLWSFGSYLPGA